MSGFRLPAGTTMSHRIEDAILRFDCEPRVLPDGGWLVVGSSTNVEDLREHLNDEGLIALVGGRIEAP